ncbi:MAG: hypothetical protein Q7R83_03170 [bacterium]|nr:hypothetical protein [bacterium]
MNTEFFQFQLSRNEAMEVYRSLLTRYVLEMNLRMSQGLEVVDPPTLLGHFEKLLSVTPEQSHKDLHQTEHELWEHSWDNFTEEWAWARAQQDVYKELGPLTEKQKPDLIEKLVERRYRDHFNAYLKEIDLPLRMEQRTKINAPPRKK